MFVSKVLSHEIFNINNQKNTNLKNVSSLSAGKLSEDLLIKEINPSFKSTSAGNPLKNLKNITDPYFGGKMITINDFMKTEKILDTKHTITQTIKPLKKFRQNMQVVEKAVYDMFSEFAKDFPRKDFSDVIKLWYQKALVRLKLEEFSVLDAIDKASMNLEPETTLAVRKETTHCRQVILDDNPLNTFKRKTVIDSIDRIEPISGEEKSLEDLKKLVNYLPSSNTSINAFIVKYSNRRHDEIAKRLIRASVQSIEHILPDSLGGANSLDNFMLASSSANSLRGNMPIPQFIEMYPEIPKNCQLYIDDIISAIHEGNLKGHQKYPYDVKKTLLRESKGLIDLDLSKFKYTEDEADNQEWLWKNRKSLHKLFEKK